MNRHASMNRIFRLVWNESLDAYVPAAETARGRGKSSKRKLIAAALSLSAGIGIAQAGPTGGQVTGGSGTIAQSGSTTTIQQSSQNLSLNWQTFNIAPKESVNFVQPNVTAIAVNRILDPNGSVILGHLNANGQVYLINPNGVLFGKGAEVNVGGLVASTLALNDGALGDAAKTFSGTGTGSIVNEGTLNAAPGGTVALLGNHVSNTGVISAQLGTVALGAGSAATLTFRGTKLVSLQIDRSVLNSVAANGGLIRADGGEVLMSAGAQKALLASVVNNTGIIEARTLENHEGTITLLGGMSAGTVNVGGTLDASAPTQGNGGAIETSAAHVEIANSAKVTTAAAMGLNGTWLIDPDGFTVAASGGDMTGTALTSALAGTNVDIASTSGGGSDGNVNINDTVSWSAHTLSLTATNDVNINAVMTASGAASLDLAPGSNNVNMGFNPDGSFKGRLDFSGSGTLQMNVAGTLQVFTVINSLGQATDAAGGANTLQGLAAPANLAGNFALGSNIDAAPTSNWNSGTGFIPIGAFTGNFDGLGHAISNLTINRGGNLTHGMFSSLGIYGQPAPFPFIRNIGLVGVSVAGQQTVGGLVGSNYGLVSNSFTAGGISVSGAIAGGLVGVNYGSGTIDNSHSGVNLSMTGPGTSSAGGLVGTNYGTITRSYATGNVFAGYGDAASIGGLVGTNGGGVIDKSYATGSVTVQSTVNDVASDIGGLVGYNNGAITQSYSTSTFSVGPNSTAVGGLVGYAYYGSAIAQSHFSGTVMGGTYVGGLVGRSFGSVTTSFATGQVTGSGDFVGGLVGKSDSESSINNSYATANVSGSNHTGGLTGMDYGTLSNTHATGTVSGANYTGGLVGENPGTITNSYAIGSVSGGRYTGGLAGASYGHVNSSFASGNVTGTLNVGGLVGSVGSSGSISNSYATGNVTGGNVVGGLAGFGNGSVTNSYSAGGVSASGATAVGGLIGLNYGTVSASFYNSSANPGLTGMSGGSGALPDVAGAVWGMSSANLQAQANFTSATAANGSVSPAWDFGATWFMYEGHTTPLLQVFMTPLAVIGTVSQTYNGGAFAPTIGDLSYSIPAPDLSQLFGTVTITGTAVGARHVGTYTFTPGGLYSDQLGYMITYNSGSLTIDPAPLTVVGSTATKVYDGTTVAPVSGGTLVGVVSGDTVTLTQGGTFASKNAGTGIAVTASDSIGGASVADYVLVDPTGVTGTITPATLTVSGTTVAGKVYNGTTVAALSGGSLVGVIDGDTVTLTQAGTFASKNVGTGIAVSSNDSLGGAEAGDYTILEPTGLSGTITPATLTVAGTTVGSKVYNGTTVAALSGGSLVGVIDGDTVTLTQAGNFASRHAGSGIAVSASDSLGGASAGDYLLVDPFGLTGTITPASLTVNGTVVGSKVYDGTAAASLTGGSLIGLVAGDSVTLNQSGLFASANVGSSIAITATDSLSGSSAGDYSIVQPTGLSGSILPAGTPSGPGVASDLVLEAFHARAQIVANLIYPQLGANPQVINAAPTIVLASAAGQGSDGASGSQQATTVNVSMKIGANGTLKIENGGLRLPSNLVVGNE
jgi:filamentous hemagglutinin family protein